MKKLLLSYGKGMKKRPRREGKKKISNPKPGGLRLRKTVRGQVISPDIVQINFKILKQGPKKLSDIFPEQNKPKQKEQKTRPSEVELKKIPKEDKSEQSKES